MREQTLVQVEAAWEAARELALRSAIILEETGRPEEEAVTVVGGETREEGDA